MPVVLSRSCRTTKDHAQDLMLLSLPCCCCSCLPFAAPFGHHPVLRGESMPSPHSPLASAPHSDFRFHISCLSPKTNTNSNTNHRSIRCLCRILSMSAPEQTQTCHVAFTRIGTRESGEERQTHAACVLLMHPIPSRVQS